MSMATRIIALAPSWQRPSGGVRKIYRHVDVLNDAGFDASVGHRETGFRCTWFENQTRVSHPPEIWPPRASDILLVPEVMAWEVVRLTPGIRKVIFNQNPYETFLGRNQESEPPPYLNPDVLATLVVSENSRAYLQYAFPNHSVYRIRNGIDAKLFRFEASKKPQVAYMERKKPTDVRQLLALLHARGALDGFDVINIQNRSEAETAGILRESSIFLSFSSQEGLAMPPMEALACGCAVVGYDGLGCREFFMEPHAFPVPQEDVLQFARAVEQTIAHMRKDSAAFMRQREHASAFMLQEYSQANESSDIIATWRDIVARV